jgi:RHS repeat-associated protein
MGLGMAGISDKAIKMQYATNKYRYNGKELQNQEFADGSGLEEYDYGARILDPQLGRWHVPDIFSEVYVALTPYQYAANNPIKTIDEGGHLLKDKDGNIIATSNGMAKSIIREVTNLDGTKQSIKIDVESVTVYTDDGTPVHALRAVKAYVADVDSKGNTGEYHEDNMYRNYRSNCHGYTFAGGNLLIGTEDNETSVQTILDHDYVEDPNGTSVDAIIWTEKDGEVVYPHSAIPNSDGTYNQKDDINPADKNASRDDFTENGKRLDTHDGQRGIQERRYNKKGDDKKTKKSVFDNDAIKGVRIVDPQEILEILKELGWNVKEDGK